VVSGTGVPPVAGTRHSPVASSLVAKTIVLSSPQVAPRGKKSANVQIVVAGSPVSGIRRIWVRSKKPTDRLSNEKNAPLAFVTPARGCASRLSITRSISGPPLVDPPER
jgi:hypothetical protein